MHDVKFTLMLAIVIHMLKINMSGYEGVKTFPAVFFLVSRCTIATSHVICMEFPRQMTYLVERQNSSDEETVKKSVGGFRLGR